MNGKAIDAEMLGELYDVLVRVNSREDCEALLDDLCTIKEIRNMAQRIRAARLLIEGKSYQQVIEMTGISSATLSRVSRCVQYGDGYKSILK